MLLSELTAKAGSILATAASGTGVSGSAGAATGSAALSIAALASAYFFHAPDLLPGLEALAECVRALKDAARVFEAPEILLSGLDNRELLSLMLPLVASSNIRLHVAEADEGLAKGLSAFFASSRQAAVSRLDLCRDKVPQDKAPDMIIAAFSMHAMADAPAALSNCHGSLKPGGLLCLLEHAPNTFTDLTLGAGPDWWTGKDQAGPISRLHSVGAWSEALAAAGFEEVQQAAPENKSSPAFLLLARKKAEPDSASAGLSRPENSAAAKDAAMLIIAASQSPASAELAPALVRALEDRGRRSELFYLDDPDSPAFDPLSKDCWRAFLAERASAGPLEIVWLAAYDKQPMPDGQALRLVLDMATAAPAALASAWDCMRCEVSLHLVAGGALPAGASAAPLVPSQGALWGFGRVLMNEMSGLNLSLIDLHGAPDHETKAASPGMAAAEVLARELTAPASSDREVILAADGRYSPRLTAEAHTPCKVQPANASLCLDNPGRLQNLYWRGTGAPKPGPGQVCIAVKALGLNYRDVLWSLGHLQEDALDQGFAGPGFGLEGAGIVESVGEGVSDLAPGDEVMAFLPSAFSARAVTDAALVMPMPAGMNFAEAATLPIALITAIYSLDHLAAMRPGESVLIHGAAGGVGLTAIQLARHKGLEIFATAGSSKKRDFLRRLGLKHVFSSRSLSFAPAVMEATGGKGVDAVLNSLAGDFMTAGLSVLKPMGRFLEIGKRDFFQDSSMRLNPFARNLSFFGIDVDQVIVHNRPLALDLIQRMVELCAKGAIAPLPHQSYARRQAQEAFQAMQHSAHIGKLVVGMDESLAGVRQALPAQSRLSLRKNAAYLVSGGTGGFGLATARRLAERGAGRLLLLSRRGA
ncbi:zinc-binding dehydrogenase, partial [Desulfovibrio sp. OttesenSCG-928-G11]|nr:zinc-binding dehydrogenase [Desulfovibrio sp. OttesenSCG-928-G11]